QTICPNMTWSPDGITIAGSSLVDGISVDLSGNIYIVDIGNARVTKWIPGATSGIVGA
ncbi:unnamed protein product, partial [Adineta steineri]